MREMKDSGIEWIGEIPVEWICDKVCRQFALIGSGTTPKSDNDSNYIGNIHWIQSGDINGGILHNTKNKVSNEVVEKYSALKVYKSPFIVIAMYGASIGNISSSIIDGCVNQACCVLSEGHMNIKYAFYTLKSAKDYLIYNGVGGGQPNISQDIVKQLRLPVPSIREQEMIADYLDKKCAEIDAVIEKTKATIEEYKKLKQSFITEAVTKGIRGDRPMKDSGIEWIGEIPAEWTTSYLKYAMRWKSIKGQPDATVLSLYRDYGVIPKDSRDDNHNVTSLDTSGYKVVSVGDFVINKMKAWQGSMAVSEYAGIISPAYHICEITDTTLNKKYLHHLLRNYLYLPEYARLSTGMRIGQWDLGYDDFKNLPFIIPHREEQDEIVEFIERGLSKYDNLIAKKTALLEEMESYKKSVIYEYVTGKKEITTESEQTVTVVYPYFPAVLTTNKARFAQAILMSKILDSNVSYMGRVKLEKMLFTIEHSLGFDFDTEYHREAAGPLDSSIYECEKIISRNTKWFYVNSSSYGVSYKPQKDMSNYKKYYERYFSDYNEEIERIIAVFKNYSLEKAEIIATLYGAWNDFIIDKKQFTDEDIVIEVLTNWNDSKKRFSKEVWLRAIESMRKNNIVPKGYGKHTIIKEVD